MTTEQRMQLNLADIWRIFCDGEWVEGARVESIRRDPMEYAQVLWSDGFEQSAVIVMTHPMTFPPYAQYGYNF